MQMKVVIVDDEPIIRMDLKEILVSNNYEVVGEASDGFDAIDVCRIEHPDLVLMDVKMPLLDGLSSAKVLIDEHIVDTIILTTAYSDAEFIIRAKEIGIAGYLVKPLDEKNMIPSIELAISNRREMNKIKAEKEIAKEQLESRKIIEKAKGLVMKQKNLSEEEAFQYIRNISKNKNISMKRVAEIILM